MADKDDIESKLRRADDDAKDALEHASGAAIEAARGGINKAPEIKQRLTEAAKRAKERSTREVEEVTRKAPGAVDTVTSAIANAPMGSVLAAGVLGILIGWAWRGSVEADKRSDMLYRLPRYWRDRLEL